MFGQNVAEYSLGVSDRPIVKRVSVEVGNANESRKLSALVWGEGEPKLVLLHGGAQNAHTWDTVALALGTSLVAIDLAGHGHSDWRDDGVYGHQNLALDVVIAMRQLAPNCNALVGMSLGGLTALEVAQIAPQLVKQLVLVDITPGVNAKKAKAVIDFVNGPQSFASFEDLLARTKEHNPTRTESSLKRGILHNARQLDDLSWEWRYDRRGHARTNSEIATSGDSGASPTIESSSGAAELDLSPQWQTISQLACELLVVRGGLSPVVDDADISEVKRRKPNAEVAIIDGAGHSIQGDRPVELAQLLRRFA